MNCIHVNTGTPYDVLIQRGILSRSGEEIKKLFPSSRLVVVTDSNVAPLYLRSLLDSLENAGYQNVPSFTLPAGENTKSLESASLLYQLLSQHKISRDCCLIALGGGVIGDLTGFVASTFLRGLSFVQIPTTLLAQVDSSVGGKTAVNLPEKIWSALSGSPLWSFAIRMFSPLCPRTSLPTDLRKPSNVE